MQYATSSKRVEFCAFLIERALQQQLEVWEGSLVGGESGNRKGVDEGTLGVPVSRWEPEPWVRTGAVNRTTEEAGLIWPQGIGPKDATPGSGALQDRCRRT